MILDRVIDAWGESGLEVHANMVVLTVSQTVGAVEGTELSSTYLFAGC